MATSRGRIHDTFRDRLQELADQAAAIAAHAATGALRPWQVPEEVDPLDVPELGRAHARDEIGANLEEVMADEADPGTVGDVKSLKCQSDYLAAMERAFRARHATPVRCLAHAAGRRRGHGSPAGVLTGAVLQFAVDALAAGQTAPVGDDAEEGDEAEEGGDG